MRNRKAGYALEIMLIIIVGTTTIIRIIVIIITIIMIIISGIIDHLILKNINHNTDDNE